VFAWLLLQHVLASFHKFTASARIAALRPVPISLKKTDRGFDEDH
jgi:hypothetical protein